MIFRLQAEDLAYIMKLKALFIVKGNYRKARASGFSKSSVCGSS